MKRAILPALFFALLLAVPAIPQGGAREADLANQVEQLKEAVARQEAQIAELQKYVEAQKSAAAVLVRQVESADKKGYLYPAPNTDARKALLYGLKDFAEVAAAGTAAPEQDEAGEE